MNAEIEKIIEEQGWDTASILGILWDYVEAQDSPEAVLEHFRHAQERENQADEGPPSELELWVAKLVDETSTAFKQFGSYTFYDKGPHEVMLIDDYAAQLKKLPGKLAGEHLEALSRGAHEGCPNVAPAILGQCDSMPENWWEACCAAAPSVDY